MNIKNSNIVFEEAFINSVDEITDEINNLGIKVGNIMYLKFDQDRPHHATIISKIEYEMIFYATHTTPHIFKISKHFILLLIYKVSVKIFSSGLSVYDNSKIQILSPFFTAFGTDNSQPNTNKLNGVKEISVKIVNNIIKTLN